jgi:hypothetical protein
LIPKSSASGKWRERIVPQFGGTFSGLFVPHTVSFFKLNIGNESHYVAVPPGRDSQPVRLSFVKNSGRREINNIATAVSPRFCIRQPEKILIGDVRLSSSSSSPALSLAWLSPSGLERPWPWRPFPVMSFRPAMELRFASAMSWRTFSVQSSTNSAFPRRGCMHFAEVESPNRYTAVSVVRSSAIGRVTVATSSSTCIRKRCGSITLRKFPRSSRYWNRTRIGLKRQERGVARRRNLL